MKNSKIDKSNKHDQIYFGKITALQPKKVKHDKGTKGSPLFNQEHQDKNQLDIFSEKKEEKF